MNESIYQETKIRQPAYQVIANDLRNDILSGRYQPGTLLPSTEDFAAFWKSSYFTVHTALKSLVKEGWVERVHGQGTYVAHPEKRFLSAGIYHALNLWSDEEAIFQRRLNECLVERFRALGKTAHIFIDSRPEHLQEEMFPDLADAIFNRQIQCVIAPNANSKSYPLLSRLSLPVAFMSSRSKQSGVNFDMNSFIQGSVRALAEQGCRSIGFISNEAPLEGSLDDFRREAAAAGLITRREWTLQPAENEPPLVEYGYRAFHSICKLEEHPEGLIVYPDMAARGVIIALLHCSTDIPGKMKVVFHRHAHTRLLCPFPVTWAITDEYAVADALIQTIHAQFAGQRPSPVLIPCTFEKDDAKRWLS